MSLYSIKRIQEEIDKCELVCANCHRYRTWERKDYLRNHNWKQQIKLQKRGSVSWHKRDRKWIVKMTYKGRNMELGRFPNKMKAENILDNCRYFINLFELMSMY